MKKTIAKAEKSLLKAELDLAYSISPFNYFLTKEKMETTKTPTAKINKIRKDLDLIYGKIHDLWVRHDFKKFENEKFRLRKLAKSKEDFVKKIQKTLIPKEWKELKRYIESGKPLLFSNISENKYNVYYVKNNELIRIWYWHFLKWPFQIDSIEKKWKDSKSLLPETVRFNKKDLSKPFLYFYSLYLDSIARDIGCCLQIENYNNITTKQL